MEYKSIAEKVKRAIETDDSYGDSEDFNVQNVYEMADKSTKNIIDNIFISLCGYSMQTLIELEEGEL